MRIKLKLTILGLFMLLFSTGCQTNDFCNIDKPTLEAEATAFVERQIKVDYFEDTNIVVETKFMNTWKTNNPGGKSDDAAIKFYDDFKGDKSGDTYKKAVNKRYKELKSGCITQKDVPGVEIPEQTMIRKKDWIDAIKQGPIELIIVFPVSQLLIMFSNFFGSSVIANIFAIVVVTFIMRSLITALTLKQTLQTHKMQAIQPEIAKIQAKYAGITDPNAKSRASQEIMKLYEKNNIKIMSAMIGPFMTLPIFLAMWGAVSQTYVLKQGTLFGVNMGKVLSSYLFTSTNFKALAFILFIISISTQFISFKLPAWKQKRKNAKKNIVVDQKTRDSQKQTQMMSNIMMIFMIFISLNLPVGILVYFISSNIFTIGSSFALDYFIERRKK